MASTPAAGGSGSVAGAASVLVTGIGELVTNDPAAVRARSASSSRPR